MRSYDGAMSLGVWAMIGGLVLLVGFGCDDEEGTDDPDAGDPADTEIEDTDSEPDANDAEIDCEPGEIVDCVGENTRSYEICNGDGDGVEVAECVGTAICQEAECVEVECLPGSGRCLEDGTPETCEPDGDGGYEYVAQDACVGEEKCEDGRCLDRCEQAEQTDSYIGCEYWAVETDNTLLHQDAEGESTVDPDHRPPFAVVLANTESELVAEVTVEGPDGEIAEAIPEREVWSRRQNPGEEWATVYSETVDANGDRIGDPHSGPIEGVELPPDATLTLLLPNQTIPFGETTVTSTAYRVETSQPVVAYQFNPFCCNYNYTNDASLLLPTSALTENYMMVGHSVWAGEALNRLPNPRGPTLTVVGLEDDTNVEVQLRETPDDEQSFEDQLYPVRDGDEISGPDGSGRMTVNLDAHEAFNLAAGGSSPVVDISGTLVQSDKPIAAFGAHTCTNIPFTWDACDHLESQLYPLETWGTEFIAAPHKIRNPDIDEEPNSREGTYWKVVARDDDTRITAGISVARGDVLPPAGENVPHCGDEQFGDQQEEGVIQMDRGDSCEFGTRRMFRLQGDNPFALAGFLSGQNTVFDQVDWGDHAGDPAMYYVSPRSQYRTEYTFLTPPTYFVSYITVVIPMGFDITLDGETIDPMDHDHEVFEEESLVMAHLEVEPGPHTIEANNAFGLTVYGYDNYVSYSYSGGLDLTKENPFEY